jgi:K+ transporter
MCFFWDTILLCFIFDIFIFIIFQLFKTNPCTIITSGWEPILKSIICFFLMENVDNNFIKEENNQELEEKT